MKAYNKQIKFLMNAYVLTNHIIKESLCINKSITLLMKAYILTNQSHY